MNAPVVPFELHAHKGLKKAEPLLLEAPINAHEQAMTPRTLAAAYAAILGADLLESDLEERLGPGCPDLERLARALCASGLAAGLATGPSRESWPALAEVEGGEIVLVLAEDDDAVILYDLNFADNRFEVPKQEFLPHLTGRVLKASVPRDELAARHGAGQKAPHWFWGELKPLRRHLGTIALGSLAANLLAVAVALFALQVYDRVIPHQSIATLWVLAIGAGLAILLEGMLRIARAQLMDGAGRRIELRVQKVLMDRILGMRRGLEGQGPSATFAAVREFGSIREFFTASTVGTLADLPFIALFLAIVAWIGGPVVWVLIVGGVLMVAPALLFRGRMARLTQETQGAGLRSGRLLHEAVYEADTIKAHRGEERFARTWSDLTALSAVAVSGQRRLAAGLMSWAQGVQQATYVAAVVAGTFLVFTGQYTVGMIIAIGILTSRTLAPLNGLAGTLARWTQVKAALGALDAVAEAEQDRETGRSYLRRPELRGLYELRDARFAYAGGTQALEIAALKIKPGQHLAILGPNGSGKSTFLRLLSGLYRPTSGTVMIDGADMGQILPRDLRRAIGYLGQDVRLFAGTLRDNLDLTGLERNEDRLRAALDFAGLGPFVAGHPEGLDMPIHDGGEGLSVGQRQSIGWARLWLQDPSVCLLDEPTAALDQTLEATLISRLEGWLAGRTAVIATHRVPILALCDRTLILQQGRLAVDGPKKDVLAHLKARSGKGQGQG